MFFPRFRIKKYFYFLLTVFSFSISSKLFSEVKKPLFQKGFSFCCYCSSCCGKEEAVMSLLNLKETRTEWIAVIVTWYQKDINSTKIFPTSSSADDESLIFILEKAHSLKMKIMLKPQLDPLDGNSRALINFNSKREWKLWFKNYKKFILHYAKIANKYNVKQFCIGCELSSTVGFDKEWREIIKDVRKIYNGSLTYASNFFEYSLVKFWNELDYAGIDAYFPLSSEINPEIALLIKGWKVWLRGIEKWQSEIKKPVIFTEIGYRSIEGTSKMPGDWRVDNKVSLKEQENCYESAFQTFYNKPWFYGFYWWCWEPTLNAGGGNDKGYTPFGKPALLILKKWYKEGVR